MSIGTFGIDLPEDLHDQYAQAMPAKAQAAVRAPARQRNEAIDAVRAFAAAGIVFVHAAESPTFDRWGNLFRFGVPFFLFASFYYQSLSLRRNPDRPLLAFAGGRFKRLYVPFLVWSLIYLLGRDVERIPLHHLRPVALRLSMLWTGTEYHLWFLPFLFGWSLAIAIIHRCWIQQHRGLRWLAILLATAAGCLFATRSLPFMPPPSEMTLDDPQYTYIQWWLSLPAACWALAFAWIMTLGPQVYEISSALGWTGITLVVVCSLRQALTGIALAPRALTGLGAILAALMPWRTSAITALARIGRKGYGIYLCHVIPVEIIHLVFHKLHLPASGWLDTANFALSFVGAWMIVAMLGRSKKLAWLNG